MKIKSCKKPLNLIILLGFICQSFARDNYLLPLIIFVPIWFLCISFSGKKKVVSNSMEFFLLLFVLVLSFRFGGDNYFSRCLALGNGFVVLQAVRLLRPLNKREQLFSTAMALTQIAVGSQVILGYSFILIIIAVLFLLPNTLYCIYTDKMFEFLDGLVFYFVILIVMLLFFLFFPRGYTITGLNFIGERLKFEDKKPILDMSDGGQKRVPEEILFKIYGYDISYLKCFSLDTFDGNIWSASPFSFRDLRSLYKKKPSRNSLNRKVEIEIPNYKRLYLPTDGYVESITGNFFYHAGISAQGNVTIMQNKSMYNKRYEYWIRPNPHIRQLSDIEIKLYTAHPETSKKLTSWLDKIIQKETNPYWQARIVENYLKDNFVYELGTPNLNKMYPLEDLIFNKKKGHCVRFASALALLLRMKNIPSRVVVGYYTKEKNELVDYYKIRARNAHAWTEGYIEGKGWLIFDATPYASNNDYWQNYSDITTYSMLYDWCEYVWYSKIVNFSQGDQIQIFKSFTTLIQNLFKYIFNVLIPISIIFIILLLVYLAWKVKKYGININVCSKSKKTQLKFAGHFYGKMQKKLAHNKIYRNDNQTPLEFLCELEKLDYPKTEEIRFITEVFCSVRYGNTKVTQKLKNSVRKALSSLN